jgi:hypothetical protein
VKARRGCHDDALDGTGVVANPASRAIRATSLPCTYETTCLSCRPTREQQHREVNDGRDPTPAVARRSGAEPQAGKAFVRFEGGGALPPLPAHPAGQHAPLARPRCRCRPLARERSCPKISASDARSGFLRRENGKRARSPSATSCWCRRVCITKLSPQTNGCCRSTGTPKAATSTGTAWVVGRMVAIENPRELHENGFY